MPSQETGSEALLGFLRDTKKQESAVDYAKTLVEWKTALSDLMAKLTAYVAPATKEKLLELTVDEVPIREEQLGEYKVPRMTIKAPNHRSVEVLPRARYVIGGKGRVDLGSGPKTAMLIWNGDAWSFSWRTPGPRGWSSAPLSEESFSEALLNLLN